MSTKSLLKFKSNRFLAQNIWPTRKISIKQKNILTKLKKKNFQILEQIFLQSVFYQYFMGIYRQIKCKKLLKKQI